jgi:hypothetical protein
MRKNFDMDAAIRRALRESIEAHAHEWEPKFETGVGPVGDDAPFDNKVSEGCDKEEACCPKCGKEKCVCGDMNEGTIPADSHEWEPGFETGVGPVGDDSPFTQAVNEAFVEGGDWEKDSFGAPNHKKEGISFADGGDECQNGVVATSQKNSGEVVSSDNLSEGEDEESKDEGEEDEKVNFFQKAKHWGQQLGDKVSGAVRGVGDAVSGTFQGGNTNSGAMLKNYNAVNNNQEFARKNDERSSAAVKQSNQKYQQKIDQIDAQIGELQGQKEQLQKEMESDAAELQGMYAKSQKQNTDNAEKSQQKFQANQQKAQFFNGMSNQYPQPVKESVESENDIIAEERDRFFNIINRIEKLYD